MLILGNIMYMFILLLAILMYRKYIRDISCIRKNNKPIADYPKEQQQWKKKSCKICRKSKNNCDSLCDIQHIFPITFLPTLAAWTFRYLNSRQWNDLIYLMQWKYCASADEYSFRANTMAII